MLTKKTRTGPNGREVIIIPLAPRALLRSSAVTVRLGPSPNTFAAPVNERITTTVHIEPGDRVRFYTAAETHQGTRDYQQDALYVSGPVIVREGEPAKVYGILCDGMGGMIGGGEASNFVVGEMRKALESMSGGQNIAAFFVEKIRGLDATLSERYGDGGTGTTMVAVAAIENKLYWSSVGDSRVYLIRADEIVQVTRDHNYYMQLLEDVGKGKLTLQEAENDPKREALISFIGSGNADIIDANTEPFQLIHGDVILLCSDGLTKSLTDEEIRRYISGNTEDIGEAARVLINTAIDIDMNAKDNTSVILIKYNE